MSWTWSAGGALRPAPEQGAPPPGVEWRPWPLRAGDFDVLEHVNNARSLEAVEDELVRFVPEPRVLRARVEYRGSLERGAEVMLASTFAADGSEGEDKFLEMSGRKGIGVKADDLMDQLIVKAREEIGKRNRDLADAELDGLARQIAVAALRFFMVKATNNRVIAFDFDEALSFEGESGPYLQYSLVRAKNIRRRLQQEGIAADVFAEDALAVPHELWSEDLWDLILEVAQIGETVEKATENLELSLIARHALEVAQRFNALYHRHPILQEKDEQVRAARLATVQIFRRGLETLSELLGVPVPEKM